MEFTTSARVAQLVNPGGALPVSDPDAALFDNLIEQFSSVAERFMGREALIRTRTEYFDVKAWQKIFLLKGYPVSSVTSVHFDADNVFGSDTLVDPTRYASPALNGLGVLEFKRPIYGGDEDLPAALKVVSTGGMANSTEEFVTLYPDIAGAVDQQVAYMWRMRNSQGVSSVSGEGGGVVLPPIFLSDANQQMLPVVRSILERHRRTPLAA